MSKDRTKSERERGILLQSGTNEVELLEFLLGDQGFGVNVAKIQAIEQFDPSRVTKMPMAHPAMAGMLLFRGHTLPLLDLRNEMGSANSGLGLDGRSGADGLAWAADGASPEGASPEGALPEGALPEGASPDGVSPDGASTDVGTTDFRATGGEATDAGNAKVVLVQEFNNFTTGFVADGVRRIHRVSWEDVYPLAPMIAKSGAPFTGSFHIDDREILIVDMERIVADIFPASFREEMQAMEQQVQCAPDARRGAVRVLLAEDSTMIRTMLKEVLHQGGYSQVEDYGNGREAFEAVSVIAKERPGSCGDDLATVLVSDIEMPSMDGLALCRNVKETLGLAKLPVVMFSSLINEQMAAKCRSVGADAHISKPEFAKLVGIIDQLALGAEGQSIAGEESAAGGEAAA